VFTPDELMLIINSVMHFQDTPALRNDADIQQIFDSILNKSEEDLEARGYRYAGTVEYHVN
jgi:hypothetical protein